MTDLEPGGPYSPERTAEVARIAAEAIRYLNHATLNRPGDALHYPADMDAVIGNLKVMAQRMPQLLGQLTGWLDTETRAERTAVTYGKFKGRREIASDVVAMELEVAAARFADAEHALNRAGQITSSISGVTDDLEGES